jgi:hypothetical protein
VPRRADRHLFEDFGPISRFSRDSRRGAKADNIVELTILGNIAV